MGEIEGEGGAFVRNEQGRTRGDGMADAQLVEDIRIGSADVREGNLRREDLPEDLVTDETGFRNGIDPHRRPARALASRDDAFSVNAIKGNGATRRSAASEVPNGLMTNTVGMGPSGAGDRVSSLRVRPAGHSETVEWQGRHERRELRDRK